MEAIRFETTIDDSRQIKIPEEIECPEGKAEVIILTKEQPTNLTNRRAFMKLPLEERRRRLAGQAEKMAAFYQPGSELME